jgi:hypothetical protein
MLPVSLHLFLLACVVFSFFLEHLSLLPTIELSRPCC